MQIEDTELAGVRIITLDVFGDDRGTFSEIYDSVKFAELGLDVTFVQNPWSHSNAAGTYGDFIFKCHRGSNTNWCTGPVGKSSMKLLTCDAIPRRLASMLPSNLMQKT
jgi:hypothetical protein